MVANFNPKKKKRKKKKKKKKAHMVQVFFVINRKIQPHLWMHPDIPCESQNLIGDPDATKTTLLQIRFLFHLQSKRVDVHLRRNHGWKFTIFTNVLDLKKREKSELFGFSVMEESMSGASLPSGLDAKKWHVSYFYKPSIGDYYYG